MKNEKSYPHAITGPLSCILPKMLKPEAGIYNTTISIMSLCGNRAVLCWENNK
jgi:hypothetical protein